MKLYFLLWFLFPLNPCFAAIECKMERSVELKKGVITSIENGSESRSPRVLESVEPEGREGKIYQIDSSPYYQIAEHLEDNKNSILHNIQIEVNILPNKGSDLLVARTFFDFDNTRNYLSEVFQKEFSFDYKSSISSLNKKFIKNIQIPLDPYFGEGEQFKELGVETVILHLRLECNPVSSSIPINKKRKREDTENLNGIELSEEPQAKRPKIEEWFRYYFFFGGQKIERAIAKKNMKNSGLLDLLPNEIVLKYDLQTNNHKKFCRMLVGEICFPDDLIDAISEKLEDPSLAEEVKRENERVNTIRLQQKLLAKKVALENFELHFSEYKNLVDYLKNVKKMGVPQKHFNCPTSNLDVNKIMIKTQTILNRKIQLLALHQDTLRDYDLEISKKLEAISFPTIRSDFYDSIMQAKEEFAQEKIRLWDAKLDALAELVQKYYSLTPGKSRRWRAKKICSVEPTINLGSVLDVLRMGEKKNRKGGKKSVGKVIGALRKLIPASQDD